MKNRIIYFDYLRIFALVAVVIVHVSAQYWYALSDKVFEWNVLNFYDGIARWGAPMFIMISGALFLSKEIKISTLYKKYIPRLLVCFIVWSLFYTIATLYFERVEVTYNSVIMGFEKGLVHMWFVPIIIGLYMSVPIIKEIIKSKAIVIYFLILSLSFNFIIPQSINLLNDFTGGKIPTIFNELYKTIYQNMNMSLILGYSFYFILGYFMNNQELSKKHRTIIYILGLIGFISTVLLSSIVTLKTNIPTETYYSYFSINVLLEIVAVHTVIKYRDYKNLKLNSIVCALTKYSFGVYLIHPFIIMVLNRIGINVGMCNPIVSVPVVSIIVIIISFILSWIINKVPLLNKWVV